MDHILLTFLTILPDEREDCHVSTLETALAESSRSSVEGGRWAEGHPRTGPPTEDWGRLAHGPRSSSKGRTWAVPATGNGQ